MRGRRAGDFKEGVISIVTPAFNEEANLPTLHAKLVAALEGQSMAFEWIVVDDHSADGTLLTLKKLAEADPRVRAIRLARNSGSHSAIRCGLDRASGACAIVMAADHQDSPAVIPKLIERWKKGGVDIVWAVREGSSESGFKLSPFSRFYYFIMRRVVGLKEMPETGSDYFLVDRKVIHSFRRHAESNANIFALLSWLGFKQDRLVYEKGLRAHGKSGWSMEKKIKLLIDSVTSFSYLPIRLMSIAGALIALVGFAYSLVIVFHFSRGDRPVGWSSLMVVVLLIGGMQMLMMGVLGEYLWRALDEARKRPWYVVEEELGFTAERPGD